LQIVVISSSVQAHWAKRNTSHQSRNQTQTLICQPTRVKFQERIPAIFPPLSSFTRFAIRLGPGLRLGDPAAPRVGSNIQPIAVQFKADALFKPPEIARVQRIPHPGYDRRTLVPEQGPVDAAKERMLLDIRRSGFGSHPLFLVLVQQLSYQVLPVASRRNGMRGNRLASDRISHKSLK
jgi:hypothetical protein